MAIASDSLERDLSGAAVEAIFPFKFGNLFFCCSRWLLFLKEFVEREVKEMSYDLCHCSLSW